MPLQRIDLVAGRSAEQRLAIADAVHRALVESVGDGVAQYAPS